MGKTRGPYEPEYPVGTPVRVADKAQLEAFVRDWKWHHPLDSGQLRFAGQITKVKDVSFYHGGDELYHLEDVPGIWHEENLEPSG